MTFSIMNEIFSLNPMPYEIVIQGAKRHHGLLYQTIPQIIPELSTYVVTPMASLHRHTSLRLAFFFQMIPVSYHNNSTIPRKCFDDGCMERLLPIDKKL